MTSHYFFRRINVHSKPEFHLSGFYGLVILVALASIILSSVLSVSAAAEIEQAGTYLEGELIIQLFPDSDVDALMADYAGYELKPKQLLSRRTNIWLFEYRPAAMKAADHSSLLESVRDHREVSLAQFNHFVTQRLTFPNDPGFGNQWDKHNTGQTGGTPDADIDAPEAWDITTGGTTSQGDDVVVAIVDGGADLNHVDIDFFKNIHEIPNNGIDDDGNGYIDDYDGWNAYSNNGNIPSSSHGTHVSGISAAIGNNGTGIAGVNWGVKVMPIAGSSGNESIVVIAYGYVLEMRATYNETDGAFGAFVVATNSSFGVDYGQPENYPIWCAMYDSMGLAGILSQAATANININIDVVGDVPTACPSDWLISVTNTNHNDVKNSGAAYGLTTIDLGAPGTSIYSTLPGNSYGTMTGTSMATPQVTGAVGFLYGAMCEGLMDAVRTDPDSIALLVKQYILDGTDPNSSLDGITVSGGRLNIFNSIVMTAEHQCGAAIVHTPLTDTRDTLNPLEVLCLISSDTSLVADSLLLHYREDSAAWQSELLVTTLNPDEYHGFIPAQSPGVVVDYYLTAIDDNGVADTTDLFTFFVIDYGVTLTPAVDSLYGGVDDTLWYSMTVTNSGVYGDDYALSVSGNSWTTELFDASGTVPVSSSGTLLMDETFDFRVRVMVPSSLYGDFDLATITATSSADGSYSDAAVLKSISVGQPQTVPYSDLFPVDSFDGAKWVINLGATIDDRGISEPSEPYSMNLNGYPSGGDVITSQAIDLRNESNIIVRYWYEQGGGGDSPETGDDMMLEYLDSNGVWQELSTHLGSGPDMSVYEEVILSLPGDAYHGTFALRFSCSGTAGLFDDWFVDDVYVGAPSDYQVLLTPWYSSQYGPADDSVSYELTVHNRGALADNYNLWSAGGSWSVTFFDAGGTIPISSTGTIAAGDSGTFIARVAIPGSALIGEVDSSSVTVVSQSDGLVMSSVAIVTTSAGLPGSFPWMEPFPDDTLVTMRWIINVGAEVSTSGLNPPSAPYSFNFDGGNDTAITQPIDLSGQTGAILAYHYQRGGGGGIPGAGDDLTIEYKNDVGVWVEVNVHAGSGPYMSEFEAVNVGLPPDAIYGGFQLRIHSVGDGVGVDDWFIDDIRLDFAPSISVSPGALGVTLAPGDSSQSELVISNGGPGALIWQSSVVPELKSGSRSALFESLASAGKLAPAHRDYPDEFYDYVDAKGSDVPSGGFPTDKNGGGPDAFGYYWLDSDEPGGPTFSWVVASGGAIDIVESLNDDNYSGPYELGFGFDYYGVVYNQIFIGSNGIIGFSSTDMASRFKTSIPSSSTPNNMLAWLWDDLNPDDADNPGAHVYIDTSGGRCIVSFIDYPEYNALPGEVVTAQVILEPSGLIRYQYLTIASGFDIANCAVGIENGDGTDGLEVAFATSYLHDALAVECYPPANWISADLSSGELASGESDTVTISFNATDLEDGTYTADIIIVSNDPDSSDNPLVVPAQLIVSTGPDVTPPEISNVAVQTFGIATDSVRISWSTDEPATSQVEYGLTVSYGSSTPLDATLVFSHVQVITGLLAGEVYHFRVKSIDAATNEATGSDSTFTIPILCGDAGNNGSGPDVSDLTYLVDYLFNGGPAPEIPVAADMDGSGSLDVADVTYLVEYLFKGGPPPICNG